ncbi:MAG TPA: DUF3568 family protein, partial [Gemmataceae bacterium]|nr:DUF3568 family protein [Gemmataceae bacterium]
GRAVFLVVAAAALANSGCLALAVGGAAAGATAVGLAYHEGKLCRTYTAGLEDVRAATHAALGDLGMKIEAEEMGAAGGHLDSRLANGKPVRIHLDVEQPKIPADGPLTRVGVRVAWFGDKDASMRVLEAIDAHLTRPGAFVGPPAPPTFGPPAPPPAQTPNWSAPQPPPETAPPPLAAPPPPHPVQPGR